MDALLKKPHDEARARIIWGDSPAEVRHWLVTDCGLTEEQADVVIGGIRKERALEIRRSGLRSLRTGIGYLVISGAIAFLLWRQIKSPSSRAVDRFEYTLFAVGVVGFLWGLRLCLKGLTNILTGQARGSLTEMD